MSVTTFSPAAVVAAPPRQPLPYGLFSVLTFRDSSPDRWGMGVAIESQTSCDPAGGIGAFNCDPEVNEGNTIGLPKDLDANGTGVSPATPFTVYGHDTCSPVARSLDRARDHLLAREEQRVEQAIWTGDLGNTPNLADTAGLILDGAAQSVGNGLAYLEYVIAQDYGSLGVIHMTRGMALHGLAEDALETKGGRLQTVLGTPVVAGSGYDGTGPEGTPPLAGGQSWAYATPPLLGYRSEVFTSSNRPGDLLDRATNDLYTIAERTYLLGWEDCGVAAVLLDQTIKDGAA